SYAAFPADTVLSHAFNLATWNSSGWETLNATAPIVACKFLRNQTVPVFEVGNAPDLYEPEGRRPASYSVEDYLSEWRQQTARLEERLRESCPEVAGKGLSREEAGKIGLVSARESMGGARRPNVTMESTLLNHTAVVEAVARHVGYAMDAQDSVEAPYVIGELNSLDGGGAEDLTDTFASALWALDFALCAASSGVIKRVHFHQAVKAPSAAWWPVRPVRTKATFYGMLAAATFLANSTELAVQEFDLVTREDGDGDAGTASGYKGYVDGELRRVAVLNLNLDYSRQGRKGRRKIRFFVVDVGQANSRWEIQRLTAPSAYSKDRISFNGFHYSPDSMGAHGHAVDVVHKDTDEAIWSNGKGELVLHVADSEAVVVLKNDT
ncbi:hypothetical protein E4U43_006689, partial [Claviceps pusilla]